MQKKLEYSVYTVLPKGRNTSTFHAQRDPIQNSSVKIYKVLERKIVCKPLFFLFFKKNNKM